MKKDIVKTASSLFLVSLVAALCLGFVYDITKEPIEEQRKETENKAMREMLPSAKSFEPCIVPEDYAGVITSLNVGLTGSGIAGYVIGVSPKGYSGEIDMLVGIDISGVITAVKIVRQTETPGLGANVTNEKFIGQYSEKTGTFTVVKINSAADNEIQAITAATITSKAVTKGVNDAVGFYNNILNKYNPTSKACFFGLLRQDDCIVRYNNFVGCSFC